MLRNLTKPTRCFASHLNIRSQVCKKYASNDLCLKTVSEQILKNNYATAARTANQDPIPRFEGRPLYLDAQATTPMVFTLINFNL